MTINEFSLLELIRNNGEKPENEYRSLFKRICPYERDFFRCIDTLYGELFLIDKDIKDNGFVLKINQQGEDAYQFEKGKCDKYGISCAAIDAINRMLEDDINKHSVHIELTKYSTIQNRDLVNEMYHYLVDKFFVESRNPNSEADKFIVQYTSKGRELHKAKSIEKYFDVISKSAEVSILDLIDDYRKEDAKSALKMAETERRLKESQDAIGSRKEPTVVYNFHKEVNGGQFMSADTITATQDNKPKKDNDFLGKMDKATKSAWAIVSIIALLLSIFGIKNCNDIKSKSKAQSQPLIEHKKEVIK